jgi:hypothetical protein
MIEHIVGCHPRCLSSSLALLVWVLGGGVPSIAQSTLTPSETAAARSAVRGGRPSVAQSTLTPSETLGYERSLMAERFASARVWVWQKRLNLQGWNISVVVSRAVELKPETLGNIHWDNDKKTATIRVLDPVDYRLPLASMLRDIEFTLVHELIHLEMVPVLSDLQRTEANRLEEEKAVNYMADALLKLDRGQ